jgi:hypothetical protein
MSEFVTGGLEEADQHHGPREVQISQHWIFLWEFMKLAFMQRKVKVKNKVQPRTGHEGPEGIGGIALLFL